MKNEHGFLVYEVEVVKADKTIMEAMVDAATGKVLAVEHKHEHDNDYEYRLIWPFTRNYDVRPSEFGLFWTAAKTCIFLHTACYKMIDKPFLNLYPGTSNAEAYKKMAAYALPP